MRTIALRFADNFAPPEGTIAAHQEVLDQYGCVWFGKLGQPISISVAESILDLENPSILLIHSGSYKRYWAFVDLIQRESPPDELIPQYYRTKADEFHTWFRIKRFESASKDVMQHYIVASSGKILSNASRYSMSPYFIIKPKVDE